MFALTPILVAQAVDNVNPLIAILSSGVGMAMMIIMIIVMGFPIFKMAKEEGEEPAWMAYVPILNFIIWLKLARKPIWWIILFFIPCVGIVMSVIVWMGICERRNKPSWMGILSIIPVANIILPFYLAFAGE